jgi:hypothetical protein
MDPSVPSTDGTCYFFRLPAELRNLVYSHALFSPEGAVCSPSIEHDESLHRLFAIEKYVAGTPTRKLSDDMVFNYPSEHGLDGKPMGYTTMELNQLRYACRQLNAETKGVAISTNEIVFLEGVSSLNRFTHECPPAILEHISTITVHQEQDYDTDELCDLADCTELVEFCRHHPATTVRLRHSWLDPVLDYFFERAIEFAVNFCKDTSLAKRVFSQPQDVHQYLRMAIQVWSKNDTTVSVDEIQGYPANLRAFPPFKVLDEAAFRAYYQDDDLLSSMPDKIDGAVALAKEIFTQGI